MKGKRRAAQNARKHGAYAQVALLPWESIEEFDKLRRDLVAEWDPVGVLQRHCVDTVAELLLRKGRVQQMLHAGFRTDPNGRALRKAGANNFEDVRRYERKLAKRKRNFESRCESLLQSLEAVADAARNGDDEKLENLETDRFKEFGNAVIKNVCEIATKARAFTSTASSAYDPEWFEHILKLEAMIDARIDKTTARIINLKEYARLEAQREPRTVSKAPLTIEHQP